MTPPRKSTKRITAPGILKRKISQKKLVCLTAYDYTIAKLIDQAGVDLILVGDSLGSVVQGHRTTLPVTLDEMVYHSKCVLRGVERALVVGDLPFMSYQISAEQALESAARLVKEAGVQAIKLEGGCNAAKTVSRLVEAEIPVMGHVGLTPQSYNRMGGHKIQGKRHSTDDSPELGTYERIIMDAKALEEAGVFSIVIEGVPDDLAAEITRTVSVPTIGIAAGPHCDGQILVVTDMLGMNPDGAPKFVKEYGQVGQAITSAIKGFIADTTALEELTGDQYNEPSWPRKGASQKTAALGRSQ